MQLLNRQIEIITLLLLKDDYCAANELADALSVSNRTIRNDLSKVKTYLCDFDADLISEPHKGHKIIADAKAKQMILSHLDTARTLTKQEIIELIVIFLLSAESTTYEEIAKQLDFSRQTIVKYIEPVENYLADWNLCLQKIKGKGVSVEGKENDIRNLMYIFLEEGEINDLVLRIAKKTFYSGVNADQAKHIIACTERKAGVQFFEHQRLELIISYSLHRISLGKMINENSSAGEHHNQEYSSYYSCLSDTSMPEAEKRHFASILLSAKVRHLNRIYNNDNDAKQLADYLMKKLQLLHPLKEEKREQFLAGLTAHLNVALYRIRNNIPIQNELVDQIKISIALIYFYTKQLLLSQEKEYEVIFDENEIAYVAMYIASAFETSVKKDQKIRVLIVCTFGTTTSAILDSRIRQLITGCEIIGPLSKTEAEEYLNDHDADLIVSTTELNNKKIPSVIVSPLLDDENINLIQSRLLQISYEKLCQNFITEYSKQEEQKKRNTVYLKDLIARENIQIMDSCPSWEDAIRIAAEPLLKRGSIEQRYIISMIDAVNKLGTYMVLLPETAFVHAGINSGITEDCCSLLVLKKTTLFGNINRKIIRRIVVLGIKNREQVTLLDLVSIFRDPANQEILADQNIDIDTILNLHN